MLTNPRPRRLRVLTSVISPLPPARGAAKQQDLLEVRAIHDRAHDKEHRAGENGDGAKAPGVPAKQSGRHAESAKRDQRLPALIWHCSGTTPTLAEGGYAPGLPGVEEDCQTHKSDQNSKQKRKLFDLHDVPECKKGARSREVGGGRREGKSAVAV